MECSRLLCPVCGAADLEERTSAGLGVVARVGAVTRTDQLALRLHQTCLVTLDEGFTIPATLSADQFAVVPPGARVRVRTFGPGPRAVEFRLL